VVKFPDAWGNGAMNYLQELANLWLAHLVRTFFQEQLEPGMRPR